MALDPLRERIGRVAPLPGRALLALHLVAEELSIAELQFRRIQADIGALSQSRLSTGSSTEDHWRHMTALFADVHFLTVTICRMWKLYHAMATDLRRQPEFRPINRRYRNMFENATDMRDSLEHIDQRLGSGVQNLGSLLDTTFTFDEQSLEVGQTLEREVQHFVEDLVTACEVIATRQTSA